MDSDVIFARVDAVIASYMTADEAVRPAVASFMTNDLALRIHNRIQVLISSGACELPKQIALALFEGDCLRWLGHLLEQAAAAAGGDGVAAGGLGGAPLALK